MKNHIAEFIKQLPPEYDEFINIITEIHLKNDELQDENKRLREENQELRDEIEVMGEYE